MRVNSTASEPDIFERALQRIANLANKPDSERGKPLTDEQIAKLAERRPVEIHDAEIKRFRTPYDAQGGG